MPGVGIEDKITVILKRAENLICCNGISFKYQWALQSDIQTLIAFINAQTDKKLN